MIFLLMIRSPLSSCASAHAAVGTEQGFHRVHGLVRRDQYRRRNIHIAEHSIRSFISAFHDETRSACARTIAVNGSFIAHRRPGLSVRSEVIGSPDGENS